MLSEANIIPVLKEGPMFCDHRRGWCLGAEAQPGPSEIPVTGTQSLWTSMFCRHLPGRMYEKLTLALDLSWDCSMKSYGHLSVIFPRRVSFSINCRKPDTGIKFYYGWVRVRGRKRKWLLLPVLAPIITWYMFCSLGGISWHRFSRQPKCCIFNGNRADVFNHREGVAKMKENPACSFFLSSLVFALRPSALGSQSSISNTGRVSTPSRSLQARCPSDESITGHPRKTLCTPRAQVSVSPQCSPERSRKSYNLLFFSAWSFLTLPYWSMCRR